jgi:hypothetical protein
MRYVNHFDAWYHLPTISITTLLYLRFPEFTVPIPAVPVGNMLRMRYHKVEGMFFIPDSQVQTLFSPSPPRRPLCHDSEPLALQAAVSQKTNV